MDLREFRISDAELEEYGVSSAPDDLTGTPAAQVKALFDRLPRKLAERLNGALETLSDEDSGPIGRAEAAESFLQKTAVTQSLGISPDRVPSELAVTQAIGAAGGGDMLQSMYDSDRDGTVDRAVQAENGLYTLIHGYVPDTTLHTLTGTVPTSGRFMVCFTANRNFMFSHPTVMVLNGNVNLTIVSRGVSDTENYLFRVNDFIVATVDMQDTGTGTIYLESTPCLHKNGGHMKGSVIVDTYAYKSNSEQVTNNDRQVRNITLSTEEPTEGVDGDLWLQYEG